MAPSAMRIAISLRRAAARAISRFATLAQAISRTNPNHRHQNEQRILRVIAWSNCRAAKEKLLELGSRRKSALTTY